MLTTNSWFRRGVYECLGAGGYHSDPNPLFISTSPYIGPGFWWRAFGLLALVALGPGSLCIVAFFTPGAPFGAAEIVGALVGVVGLPAYVVWVSSVIRRGARHLRNQ